MIWIGLAIALSVSSQVIYTCDFENAQERQAWQLNVGKNAALIGRAENKWYIDEAGNHDEKGSYGLFISDDGTNGTYKNSKSFIMFAYRDIELQPGNYTLSFDWIGNTSAVSGEGLYACVVPVSDPSVSINSGGQVVPDWVNAYKLNETVLGGASTWQICTSAFSVLATSGTSHRIVFVWFQNASQVTSPPSIAIDNICLWGAQKCAPPMDISYTITSTDLKLTWKGQADYYDVKVYDYQEDKWQYFPKVGSRTLSISNLSEGVHDIYIRAHCGTEESEYVLFKPFYYQRGSRCIDYLSLDDSKAATCYTGNYDNQRQTTQRPKFVDLLHGSEYQGDNAPLFSIHYIPDEFDPYSGNELRTKPDGAAASIRLGRYAPTFGACIEHRYKVPDGDRATLKLKYAVVLPNPHPQPVKPTDIRNPKFTLAILVDGKAIPDGCGSADFVSGDDGTGDWHSFMAGGDEVLWKDWTEVSVNLRDYVGKTVTVRLSTTGCSASAHGGYAYYTLECESGGLTGINCGDIPTTQFVAPSGFDYAWYLPDKPDSILSTDRIFNVDPMDTLTYSVDIISKTNSKCYYTLDATAVPRFPVAEATYERSEDVCENKVIFHQTCHVKYKNQITDREWVSDSKVESIVWDFGDGSAPLTSTNEYISHTFPREGGQYTVTLTAGINDNLCTVSYTMDFSFPNVQEKPVLVAADICEGDCYPYNGKYYCNTYIDTIHYDAVSGCDSMVIFHIIVHDKDYYIKDTTCYDSLYTFGKDTLYSSGQYVQTYKGATGCDSIVHLDLYMESQLLIDIPDTMHICPETNTIVVPYLLHSGRLDSIAIRFDSLSCASGFDSLYIFSSGAPITIGMPDSLQPNRYWATISYFTPLCEVAEQALCIELGYSSSVLWQKSDLIAITNDDYNGGFEFTSYQWYRDGEPIPGATGPNLAMTEEDRGHEFYVVVRRLGDGVQLGTCSIIYGATGVGDVILPVTSWNYPIEVYSVIGTYMGDLQHISEVNNLPSGIYLLTDGERTTKIVR